MKKLGKQLIDYHFILIIVIVLLFPFLQSYVVQVFSPSFTVRNESELVEAVRHSRATITINDTIHLESYITIRTDVTIGGTGVITVANPHRHFVVERNGILRLTGDVTLTLSEDYTGYGGGIAVNGGMLVMRGAQIVGNNWVIAPEDRMDYGSGHGGGVRVSDGGTFHLYNGTISNNTAIYGGGVNLTDFGSRFIMRGGYIQHNHANFGGGFLGGGVNWTGYFTLVTPSNAFQMYGGIISENTARFIGGGVSLMGWPDASLHGGQISNNEATAHGGIYRRGGFYEQFVNIGIGVRIIDNYPANFDETPTHHLIYDWVVTPTIYRLLAVFAIAIVGCVCGFKRKKSIL